MWSNISWSSRPALSAEQTLERVNTYLNNARNTLDSHLASVFCEDAEISLSQAKSAFKKARNPKTTEDHALRNKLAAAYKSRGDVLKELGQSKKAEASYLKARKWGYDPAQNQNTPLPSSASNHRVSTYSPSIQGANTPSTLQAFISASLSLPIFPKVATSASIGLENRDSAPVSVPFFSKNLSVPVIDDALPVAGKPPKTLQQLANGLILLSLKAQVDLEKITFSEQAQAWLDETEEADVKRLHNLATDVVRVFIDDQIKELSVAQVVILAPGLSKELFNALLKRLINGIERSTLLETDLLDGLAQMIRNAAPESLDTDDLVKIVEVISERLQNTHGQSEDHLYRLTVALSRVLDAMTDYVQDVDRERLREPLLGYLKGLRSSSNPYLVYQAAYACQALAHVPDDETPWQGTVRRGSSILKGVSGLISAVKGFDLNQIVDSLGNIADGVGGPGGVWDTIIEVHETVTSLAESGQDFVSCLKEGLTFEKKEDWYKALEGVDVLLQQRKLSDVEEFVRQVRCRQHKAFQWGLIERLGQLAANPQLDEETQLGALRFLGDLYANDALWGKSASAKKRIIQIIKELSIESNVTQEAKALLTFLAQVGDEPKRALYAASQKDPMMGPEPLYKQPILASNALNLLERAQNKPKVEDHLLQLKRERLKAWKEDERLYVKPLGKAKFHDTETFDLTEKVDAFLSNPDKKTLLLLGDSGAGKSTFNSALEARLWQAYYLNNTEQKRIPLLIALPEIDDPTRELVEKHLSLKGFSQKQIRELKKNHEFVFILDSYDESQQSRNLYLANKINQEGGWQGQMIIGCRSEYFGEDDQSRFEPKDRTQLQKIVIAPFSDQEIERYTEAYAKANPLGWSSERYQEVLNSIPHLKELVTNPFMLKITLDVLPRLTNQEQELTETSLTRLALYDEFVEQWFERGKQRFLNEKNLQGQEKKVFEELIDEGFTKNGIAFVKALAVQIYERQRGNPIVKYVRFEDQKTWKQEFFGPEDEKRLLREAWPVNHNKNHYQFIHKSLLEYFVARALWEPNQPSQTVQKTALLNQLHLVKDTAVLGFLAERVRQEPVFKAQLLDFIEHSKWEDVQIAAANALTILVRAQVPLSAHDFSGIRVTGADLRYGVFDHTKFNRADLTDGNLQGAWLRGAQFHETKLTGVEFGEKPTLEIGGTAEACTYSPDGRWLAVGTDKGLIQLYKAESLTLLASCKGHDGYVHSVSFSGDGKWLASGGRDKRVKLWSVASEPGGLVDTYTYTGHTKTVGSVSFSRDGKWIASGSYDRSVKLWSVASETRGQVYTYEEGHSDCVTSVSFSGDGQWLASGGRDKCVKLWSVASETRGLVHTYEGHDKTVSDVSFSNDGKWLASGSEDGSVKLWSVASETRGLVHTYEGHRGYVISVSFSPDGQWLASGGYDRSVKLWSVASEPRRLVHTYEGHHKTVRIVSFSDDGKWLASGSKDGSVKPWSVASATQSLAHTYEGHHDSVHSVSFSRNGQWLASGSEDGSVKLWSAASEPWGPVHTYTYEGHHKAVSSVSFSDDGKWLASGSYDRSVKLWSVASKSRRLVCTYKGHHDGVTSVSFSGDGKWLASGGRDKCVKLWSVASEPWGLVDTYTYTGHAKTVSSVSFSPDGKWLASGSYDHSVNLWSVASEPRRLVHTYEGHHGSVRSVNFSPNGQWLASGSEDGNVELWSVASEPRGLVRTYKGHRGYVISVSFSPDGQWLASGSEDGSVKLWSLASTSRKCVATIQGCNGDVNSVAWQKSAEGYPMLATGGKDKAVRLWKIEKEGEGIRVILSWTSYQATLTAADASIKAPQGLSSMNALLLKQRGAAIASEEDPSGISRGEDSGALLHA